jgi:hypothetical protein
VRHGGKKERDRAERCEDPPAPATVEPVVWLLLPVCVVALLQGVAWLGAPRGQPRPIFGAALACAGMLGLGLTLLHLCAPGFFAG